MCNVSWASRVMVQHAPIRACRTLRATKAKWFVYKAMKKPPKKVPLSTTILLCPVLCFSSSLRVHELFVAS
jgi:hypothetical protein